jgi:two-component system, LuxR family, response regulator FixJ
MLVEKTPTPASWNSTPKETDVLPRVYVVDDEPSIQALFRRMSQNAGFEVVTFGTANEFLDQFDDSRPGSLVLDLNLPDRTGIEVLEELAARGTQIPVVFMSGMARVSEAVRALKLGSIDFVEKPFEPKLMIETIHRAIAEDLERRNATASTEDIERRFARLSPREIEVLELVVNGAANKEVAAKLGLSPKTVEVHRANVMRKTGANSLAELVRIFLARSS